MEQVAPVRVGELSIVWRYLRHDLLRDLCKVAGTHGVLGEHGRASRHNAVQNRHRAHSLARWQMHPGIPHKNLHKTNSIETFDVHA